MNRKLVAAVLILAALALAACRGDANVNTPAANTGAASGGTTTGGSVAGGGASVGPARDVVAAFPDSRAVAFFNARRVFTEVLPRLMPQGELDKMFADAQRETGIDLRQVEYVGLGLRYREPVAPRTPPDILVVVKGNFDPNAIINQLAKQARGGRTQEAYKGRTIELLRQRPASSSSSSDNTSMPPMPEEPYNELAAVVLDSHTAIIGLPSYVKAAIDAADGQGRINAQLADLVMRNPDNLLSFGGDVPASFADMARGTGMLPPDPDAQRVLSSMKQVQAAISMTQSGGLGGGDFKIEATIKTDTPETANWMKQLIDTKLAEGRTAIEEQMERLPPDRAQDRADMQLLLSTMGSISNTARDNELQLSITIPQATVTKMMERSRGGARPTP